jgi:DNA primase
MSPIEMESFLKTLEIDVIRGHDNELVAKCPGHLARTGKEDKNPSWSINASNGRHNCWSCGFKGSLTFLIAYVTGTDMDSVTDAKSWVVQNYNTGLTAAFNAMMNPIEEEKPVFLEESSLALFTSPPEIALRSRGILSTAAAKYGILWDPKKQNWILPIREPHTGELLGWQAKAFKGRYFNNYPNGVKKGRTLFGLLDPLPRHCIIVESPLDCARFSSVISDSILCLSTYGATVTKDQKTLIEEFEHVTVALDNDDAGKVASRDLLSWAEKLNKGLWFFDYSHTDQKDIGGMSKAEISIGMQNAKFSLLAGKALQ